MDRASSGYDVFVADDQVIPREFQSLKQDLEEAKRGSVTPSQLETVSDLATRALAAARNRNRIDNGNFRTNQRNTLPGATPRPMQYGFDRWQSSGWRNQVQNPTGGDTSTAAKMCENWTTGSSTTGSIAGLAVTIPGVSHQGRAIRSTPGAGSVQGLYMNGNVNALGTPLMNGACQYIRAGVEYNLSMYVRSSVAKSVRLGAELFNIGGSPVSAPAATNFSLSANTWTRISINVMGTLDGIYLTFFIYANSAWATGNTLDVAAAQLTEGRALYPYTDGSTGMWEGTPNHSSSYSVSSLGALSFTAAPQGQPVTLATGRGIQQVIARENLEAGAYVLSWTGTAQARVWKFGSGPSGSFATGPITFIADGTDEYVVEFQGAGTVSLVQVELGSVPTPFERISKGTELTECKRYFYAWAPGEMHLFNTYWNVALNGGGQESPPHPVEMRSIGSVVDGTNLIYALIPYMAFRYLYNNAAGTGNYNIYFFSGFRRPIANYVALLNGGNTLAVNFWSAENLTNVWVTADF